MPTAPVSPPATVAQSASAASEIILWAAIVIGVILVGSLIVYAVRGYALRSDDDAGAGAAGFTLHELRELHKNGQLSDDEFETARAQLIGRLRGAPDETDDDQNGTNEPPADAGEDAGGDDLTTPAS